MVFSELLAGSGAEPLPGRGDEPVYKVASDSRTAAAGTVFFELAGGACGAYHARAAKERGALVVTGTANDDCADAFASDVRAAFAQAAAKLFGDPAGELRMIGVTGTNGKTSTAWLLNYLLNACGVKCGYIGTLHGARAPTGELERGDELTTPEPPELHRLLRALADDGCAAAVMEASSQGLDQGRLLGIEFELGIFTNLGRDHLDYHKTQRAYLEAKRLLFAQSRAAALNADDPAWRDMAAACNGNIYTYNVEADGKNASARSGSGGAGLAGRMKPPVTARRVCPERGRFTLCCEDGEYEVKLKTPGLFAVYNALAAAAAAIALGCGARQTAEALCAAPAPEGRLQRVELGAPFSLFIDFAHTPDALEALLKAARGFCRGRIIVLFGCGGDRDAGKRGQMGAVASRLADFTVITTCNPRREPPLSIMSEIERGFLDAGAGRYAFVEDRRKAIELALRIAQRGDVVLLAGKGQEKYQIFADERRPFDEAAIARKIYCGL